MKTSPDQDIFQLPNRMVHEPARLAILTVLCSCESADFVFLGRVTGLTKGNLSVQLVNLEQAGLIVIKKEIVERKMRTTVKLSKRGVAEIEEYWQTMDAFAHVWADKKTSILHVVLCPRPPGSASQNSTVCSKPSTNDSYCTWSCSREHGRPALQRPYQHT